MWFVSILLIGVLMACRFAALNTDLMQQLVDRDDLHMAQDSMLVDIDDLTRCVNSVID
jgi:ABC-type enterochelin transport system permease subunit